MTKPSASGRAGWAATAVMILGLIALVIPFGGAFARSSSPATLFVSFGASAATTSGNMPDGTSYVISGCGYAASGGLVTVVVQSPVGTGWTARTPNGDGCISVSNFSTQGAGHYSVAAWQSVRNKARVVASTYFDLN